MNIDYGKIIETAERRRATLEELASKLEHSQAMYEDLLKVKYWVEEVQSLHNQLDAEGRKLLPQEVQTALGQIGSTHTRITDAIVFRNSLDSKQIGGLRVLADNCHE